MSLRVLVTRPQAQASTTVAALENMGHKVLCLPCLEIVAVSPDSKQAVHSKYLAMDLDAYAHVIVVSTNAAAGFLPLAEDYWPQWPAAQTWWGMGVTTQAALIAAQLPQVMRPSGGDTSEALLENLLPVLNAGDKVLIVRGVGGRETLANALRERGAKVDYAECYLRQLPTISSQNRQQLQQFSPQVVVTQSGDTLRNFDLAYGDCVPHWSADWQLLLPSERVLTMAQQMGYQQCLLSAGASDQAICHTLSRYEARLAKQ